MNTKHTPGPWRYTDGGIIDIPKNCLEIADVYGADIHDDKRGPELLEAQANARLIAAAPELLEACKKSTKYIEQLCATVNSYALQLGIMQNDKLKVYADDFREQLDKAIAKAEGK